MSTLAGVLRGAAIPAGWSLDFSIALTFMALLVLSVHRRSEAGAALVAAVVVLPAPVLPHKLGLLVAVGGHRGRSVAAPLRPGGGMSTGVLLLSMAACGLVTFLIRLSFIAFGQHLPNDPRLTAALLVARLTRSVLATIAAGMLALWVVQALG